MQRYGVGSTVTCLKAPLKSTHFTSAMGAMKLFFQTYLTATFKYPLQVAIILVAAIMHMLFIKLLIVITMVFWIKCAMIIHKNGYCFHLLVVEIIGGKIIVFYQSVLLASVVQVSLQRKWFWKTYDCKFEVSTLQIFWLYLVQLLAVLHVPL